MIITEWLTFLHTKYHERRKVTVQLIVDKLSAYLLVAIKHKVPFQIPH